MPHVLVPLAQGCEELEAITITDLLVRAGIEVTTCGLDDQPVTASRGTVIIPKTTIDAVADQDFDAIILPGGLPGADHLRDHPVVQQLLSRHGQQGKLLGAICAAPRALAAAGVLAGKTVTAYPGSLADSLNQADNVTLKETAVEIDGNVITSRGPGTAMDFALSLIEQLAGREKREEVEAQLVREP